MIIASELREGMTVRIEDQIYKVLEVASRVGAAKMGRVVFRPCSLDIAAGRQNSFILPLEAAVRPDVVFDTVAELLPRGWNGQST